MSDVQHPALAARERLRQHHQVTLVDASREGHAIEAQPGGTFGFTFAPAVAAPIFRQHAYRSYEMHRLRSGEAAVVGFKHEVKGEGVAAFVILAKGAEKGGRTAKALQSHVRTMIGALAVPDQIHFTEVLPKTRSGKIMRRLLRDVANGVESKGDMSTLDDLSVLAKLRQDEE